MKRSQSDTAQDQVIMINTKPNAMIRSQTAMDDGKNVSKFEPLRATSARARGSEIANRKSNKLGQPKEMMPQLSETTFSIDPRLLTDARRTVARARGGQNQLSANARSNLITKKQATQQVLLFGLGRSLRNVFFRQPMDSNDDFKSDNDGSIITLYKNALEELCEIREIIMEQTIRQLIVQFNKKQQLPQNSKEWQILTKIKDY